MQAEKQGLAKEMSVKNWVLFWDTLYKLRRGYKIFVM